MKPARTSKCRPASRVLRVESNDRISGRTREFCGGHRKMRAFTVGSVKRRRTWCRSDRSDVRLHPLADPSATARPAPVLTRWWPFPSDREVESSADVVPWASPLSTRFRIRLLRALSAQYPVGLSCKLRLARVRRIVRSDSLVSGAKFHA
jgi:hypothetical protein